MELSGPVTEANFIGRRHKPGPPGNELRPAICLVRNHLCRRYVGNGGYYAGWPDASNMLEMVATPTSENLFF